MGDASRSRMLYVGGLDDAVTPEILKSAFIPFGEIVDVQVPRDFQADKSRGFGFVEFAEDADAQDALANMDSSEIFGRVIRVNVARPQQKKGKAAWEEADAWYATLKAAEEREEREAGEAGDAGAAAAAPGS